MVPFKGLTPDAFAAYTPEKWASNVHNLKRMRVKEALVALCEQAQASLKEELSGLERAASDEAPNIINHKKVDAQWVYWYRDAAARTSLASFLEKTPLVEKKLFDIAPHDKHLILGVAVRHNEVWVGLRLTSGAVVDRRNFAAMLSKAWERDQLVELLHELPEGALIGDPAQGIAASEIKADALGEIGTHLGDEDPTWQLGHSITAEEAAGLGVELADHVGRWIGALAPHYRFLAWTRTNDHIDVNKQIQEEKVQKRRQALNFNTGDKVRIVSGVFTGKTGVVQEIDTRAQVRVRVGLMSVVVPGTDLTPVG